MKNVLDYVLNAKKLMTVKELREKLDASQSTIYAMARGEKPIPEKIQERLSEIFSIRKEMWGKDLIPPAFYEFILEDAANLNTLEREVVAYAQSASTPKNYSHLVGVQPAGDAITKKNFPKTMRKRVPDSTIMPFIESDSKRDYLQRESDGKGFYVWGVRARVYNQWVKLSPKDIIMFSAKGKFFLWGTVALTLHSPELSRKVGWEYEDEDELFEYIYLLTDVHPIDKDVKDYNKLLGYSLSNRVQGFQVLDMEKSRKIIQAYDFNSESKGKSVEEDVDSREEEQNYIEQEDLRAHLFGNRPTGECCMCGKHFPVKGLTPTYIKKLSECDAEERQDRNVVVPMCKACDVWFEEGYITVNSSGYKDCIQDMNFEKVVTTDLLNELTKINGQKCFYWNQENKKYFEWHYHYHRMTN